MLVDFHSHCLPGVDDGPKNVQTAVEIVHRTRRQGVDIIVATPHFFAHRESVGAFLERRRQAFDKLKERLDGEQISRILLGAEVALERDFSLVEDVESLCFGTPGYILLELPPVDFREWMIQEIQNVAYKHSVTPVIAHLERCVGVYTRDDIERILSLEDCVFQFNNEALFSVKTLRFALCCAKKGAPVVFGSDSHDLSCRAPDFDRALKIAAKKKIDLYSTYI